MLAVTSAFDQENLPVVGSGKAFSGLQQARKGGKIASAGPSGGSVKQPQRKALGEITNTPRRALGEITNKQVITNIPQKATQKAPVKTVKAKKPKQVEPKLKVPDVEKLYPFNYAPSPDVPDFNINSFLVPVMPYSSFEYVLSDPDVGFVPEEFVFDAPSIEDMHVSDIHIGIDDSSLTDDLIIGL